MLNEMSSLELWYWFDKSQSEYLGDERADYRAARIESNAIRMSGALGEGETAKPIDCMVFLEKPKTEEERRQDEETLSYHRMAAMEGLRIAEETKKKLLAEGKL